MKNIFRAFLLCTLIAVAFIIGLGLIFIIVLIGCSVLFISTFISYFDKIKKTDKTTKRKNYIDADYEIIDKEND